MPMLFVVCNSNDTGIAKICFRVDDGGANAARDDVMHVLMLVIKAS